MAAAAAGEETKLDDHACNIWTISVDRVACQAEWWKLYTTGLSSDT